MIKASELRIGNFFSCDAGIKQVSGTDKFGFIYFEKCIPSVRDSRRHQSQCEPVQLNEEILIKAEFTKELVKLMAIYKTPKLPFDIIDADGVYLILQYAQNENVVTFKYLHKLQNLYFDFTGEELPTNL